METPEQERQLSTATTGNSGEENMLSTDGLSYEEAYTELQSILHSIQEEGPALGEFMDKYKRGKALAAHCKKLLETAQFELEEVDRDYEEAAK